MCGRVEWMGLRGWLCGVGLGLGSVLVGLVLAKPAAVVGLSTTEAAAARGAACKWYVRYAPGCADGSCSQPEGSLYRLPAWPWQGDVYAEALQNKECREPGCGYYQVAVPCTAQ